MSCKKCASLVSKMCHRITIQAENTSLDAGGGATDPWGAPITFATMQACILPLTGREALHAMQLQDSVTHKITMRFKAGIIAKHRIKFGTRFFNIRRVINVEEANRFIEIMAQEGVAT